MNPSPAIVLAANRDIGLQALRRLIAAQMTPVALLLPSPPLADGAVEAMRLLLPLQQVLTGKSFRQPAGIARLRSLGIDYLLSVHFPYVLPAEVLDIPRIGTLNLHPAYLPYNRGWHTPSWAIAEQTPYGATLHWVDESLDTGDIALQRHVPVRPSDTADALYQRVLRAELELLDEAIPALRAGTLPRVPQSGQGSSHRKGDLESMRRLDLSESGTYELLLRRLRALTTNRWEEAAWFEHGGDRFLVRVEIKPETTQACARAA
jgi:methionyl-tRNA formyltransferase